MKKANFINNGIQYDGFIIIETLSDLFNYFHERLYGMQKESAFDLVKRHRCKIDKHSTDAITFATEKVTEINNRGIIYNHAKIMGTLQNDMIKCIDGGFTIAINPINYISYFTISKDIELEFINVEKYTTNDIKLHRWPGGNHWYAKIRYIDVVIDGECKWNTPEMAKKMAEKYLKDKL